MKRFFKPVAIALCAALLISLFPLAVYADTGPKPSVHIVFRNLGQEKCFGTLISERPSTGPASVWDGDEEHIENYDGTDIGIWRAFVSYKDSDGYYYLQRTWDLSGGGGIDWTYYPPSRFKVLLYFPESGEFAVSGICESYAFDSYFTVDMSGRNISSTEYDEDESTNIRMNRSYSFGVEAISFAARLVITVAVELLIALAFGFKKKRQILFIIGVNAGTQILLTLLLNIIYPLIMGIGTISPEGANGLYYGAYALLEVAVFITEAALYCKYMDRLSEKPHTKRRYILYSLAANSLSFVIGLIASEIVPILF